MFKTIKRSVALCLAFAITLGFLPVIPQQAALAFGEENSISMLVAGDEHTVALLDDGSVWAWGNNRNGQIGDGTTFTREIPVMVIPPSESTPVVAIAAGASHTLAVLANGELLAWGNNRNGQLGDSTTANRLRPRNVIDTNGNNFIVETWNPGDEPNVSAGHGHTMAIGRDGSLYGWGLNNHGQLGLGDNRNRINPTLVANVWEPDGEEPNAYGQHRYEPEDCVGGAELVAAGYNFTLAVLNGNLYSFGNNTSGQLGQGDTINRNRPMRVWGHRTSVFVDPVELSPESLRAGSGHAMVIEGGTLYGWGSNDFGQIDLSGRTNRVLEPMIMRENVVDAQGGYHHTIIHQSDDTVLIHGYNSRGQLGNGIAEMMKSSNLVMIDDPDFEFDFDFDPDLDYDMEDEDFIPQVPEIEFEASYITAGYYYSAAIDASGELWLWGENGFGQLGDATFTRRLRPFRLPKKVFYEDIVPVRTVTTDRNSVNVGRGYRFGQKVTVTVNPANALYSDIHWEIHNPDIAIMIPMGPDEDEWGNVTHSVWVFGSPSNRRDGGSTILRAAAYNGKNVSITINVRPDPVEVVISPRPSRLVQAGSPLQLRVEVRPSSAYLREVIWSLHDSEYDARDLDYEGEINTGIAEIDPETGMFTSLGQGEVWVRAQSKQIPEVFDLLRIECGIFADETRIYEEPYDGTPQNQPRSIDLYIGYDADGKESVVPKAIYAVNFPHESDGSDFFANEGVTWKTSSSAICAVFEDEDEPGKALLVARKPGSATITATAADGSRTSAKITVNVIPVGRRITITAPRLFVDEDTPDTSEGTVSVIEGGRLTFRPSIIPKQASQVLNWTMACQDPNHNPHGATTVCPVGTIHSSNGIFTARGEGSCEIVGRTIDRDGRCEQLCIDAVNGVHICNPVEVRITVNVIRPITRLVLTPRNATVTFDPNNNSFACAVIPGDEGMEDALFTCFVTPGNATFAASEFLQWSSSNTNVAYFDNGELRIIGSGTTRITVTATDTGRKATSTLRVLPRPTGIRIENVPRTDLATGKSVRLKAIVTPREASQEVDWEIVDGDYATVDDRGRVTAIGEGEVTVRATSKWDEDLYAEVTINCVIRVSSFKVQPTSATVLSNSEARFRVMIEPFSATSQIITMLNKVNGIELDSDEVDDDGYITLSIGDIRGGPFTVTLVCDGRRVNLRLTVRDPPDGIDISRLEELLDRQENIIWRGRTIAAGSLVNVEPRTADQNVVWYSSNESVVRVDAKGNIRGMGPGTATISIATRAVDEDGAPLVFLEDAIEIECVVPVSSIRFNPSRAITLIENGEPYELGVEILPHGAYMSEAEDWEFTVAGKDSVIDVEKNDDGLVIRPGEPGNVTLNVIHPLTGRRASIKVTVAGDPTDIVVRPEGPRVLRRGTKLTLNARVLPASANQRVFWESEDTSVVRVSNSGAITVVGPGTAKVWAWTYNAAGEEVTSNEVEIETIIPVTGIAMTPNTRTLNLRLSGDGSATISCEARPFPEAHPGVSSEWQARSSRPAIATADINPATGDLDITAVAVGQTNITVRYGGKSVIIKVNVRE